MPEISVSSQQDFMFLKFIYKSNILQVGMFYRILKSIMNDKPKG